MNKEKWNAIKVNAMVPVIIIVLAFAFVSVLIIATGSNPILAFRYLIQGAFGSSASLINTINRSVPICFAAFAVAFSKKAGVFNIGIEGQLIMGAFGSTLAGLYLKGLPAAIHIPIALLAGMLFGALYAVVPTVLHVKRGANLLVTCIMMNNIATLLTTYLIVGPFLGENEMLSATDMVEKSATLPYLITKPNRLSIGILIALGTAVLLWVFFRKTVYGYEMQMCGSNREAARYAGIKSKSYITFALLLSGAFGGLGGAVEILGNYHRMYDGFSPGYGFDGIPIALLTGGNPFGMIIGSILYGGLRVGSMDMQTKAGVSTDIISVIQGTLILLIACEAVIHFKVSKASKKKEVKA